MHLKTEHTTLPCAMPSTLSARGHNSRKNRNLLEVVLRQERQCARETISYSSYSSGILDFMSFVVWVHDNEVFSCVGSRQALWCLQQRVAHPGFHPSWNNGCTSAQKIRQLLQSLADSRTDSKGPGLGERTQNFFTDRDARFVWRWLLYKNRHSTSLIGAIYFYCRQWDSSPRVPFVHIIYVQTQANA